PTDEVLLGRTHLLFVEDMVQLPDLPVPSPHHDPSESPLSIKKRLRHTRFLTPSPPAVNDGSDTDLKEPPRHRVSRDLSRLYRLALDMGSASSYPELVGVVLDGLLETIPADAGAILSVKEGRQLEVVAHRHRDPGARKYLAMSQYVSNEVLSTREAILAED